MLGNFTTGTLVTDEDVLDGNMIPGKIWTQHYVRLFVPSILVAEQDEPVVYFNIRAWNSKNGSSKLTNVAVPDFGAPQKRCRLPALWPDDLTSRVRRTPMSTTKATENEPAGPAEDRGSALPQPRPPAPPAWREISSVNLLNVGLLFIVILLLQEYANGRPLLQRPRRSTFAWGRLSEVIKL